MYKFVLTGDTGAYGVVAMSIGNTLSGCRWPLNMLDCSVYLSPTGADHVSEGLVIEAESGL